MKRVVFVTGGAQGLGRAAVEHFVNQGDRVFFCDIITPTESPATARFFEVDVRNADALERAMRSVSEECGGIDIVINNVGISKFTPLEELSIEEFDQIIATNLRPALITSRFMARERNSAEGRSRYGRIINIASTRYLQSEAGSEGYAASKGGIVSLTHALAISLSSYNITVNCISPGWIDTGHYPITPADKAQHPSGRVGTPQDIARLCGYLCDEANDFINGENIVVDGGMTKRMIYEE